MHPAQKAARLIGNVAELSGNHSSYWSALPLTNNLNGQFHSDNQAESGPLSHQNCGSARLYV